MFSQAGMPFYRLHVLEERELKLQTEYAGEGSPQMACILVVEDDSALRSVIRLTLEHEGHLVLEAENGVGALELVSLHEPDLMIVDIAMPHLDGVETIRASLRKRSKVKVVAVSGIPRYASCRLNTAQEAGAHAVLQKPFSRDSLLQTVEAMLATKRARHSVRLSREVSSLFGRGK